MTYLCICVLSFKYISLLLLMPSVRKDSGLELCIKSSLSRLASCCELVLRKSLVKSAKMSLWRCNVCNIAAPDTGCSDMRSLTWDSLNVTWKSLKNGGIFVCIPYWVVVRFRGTSLRKCLLRIIMGQCRMHGCVGCLCQLLIYWRRLVLSLCRFPSAWLAFASLKWDFCKLEHSLF